MPAASGKDNPLDKAMQTQIEVGKIPGLCFSCEQ